MLLDLKKRAIIGPYTLFSTCIFSNKTLKADGVLVLQVNQRAKIDRFDPIVLNQVVSVGLWRLLAKIDGKVCLFGRGNN